MGSYTMNEAKLYARAVLGPSYVPHPFPDEAARLPRALGLEDARVRVLEDRLDRTVVELAVESRRTRHAASYGSSSPWAAIVALCSLAHPDPPPELLAIGTVVFASGLAVLLYEEGSP